MPRQKDRKRVTAPQSQATRITVTLPQDEYETVRSIADDHRASASWVVREAVSEYLTRRSSQLLGQRAKVKP